MCGLLDPGGGVSTEGCVDAGDRGRGLRGLDGDALRPRVLPHRLARGTEHFPPGSSRSGGHSREGHAGPVTLCVGHTWRNASGWKPLREFLTSAPSSAGPLWLGGHSKSACADLPVSWALSNCCRRVSILTGTQARIVLQPAHAFRFQENSIDVVALSPCLCPEHSSSIHRIKWRYQCNLIISNPCTEVRET